MLYQSKLINSFITGCLCRVPHLMVTKKKKNRWLLTGNDASLSDYEAISVCDRMRTLDNNNMCAIGIQESIFFKRETIMTEIFLQDCFKMVRKPW